MTDKKRKKNKYIKKLRIIDVFVPSFGERKNTPAAGLSTWELIHIYNDPWA